MAHLRDAQGRILGPFAAGSGHINPVSIPNLQTFVGGPAPGDVDTGGILGSLIDIFGGIIGGQGPATFEFPPAPGGTLPPLPQNGDFTLGGAIPAGMGCLPNPCCSGQHLNKSRGCDGSPPGTKCVTNRRMNSLNPRALRRATRRLKGFERAVKSTRKQLRTACNH